MTVKLIKIIHIENDVQREEVVSPSSDRFFEIVASGQNPQIAIAPENARIGETTITRPINYREGDDIVHRQVSYRAENGLVKITDFEPFTMRGFEFSVVHTPENGDLLQVNLSQSKFILTDRDKANDIVNALRRCQTVNTAMLDDVDLATDSIDNGDVTLPVD